MPELPEEFIELQNQIRRDRQELEEARSELARLGRELKKDWVEKAARPRRGDGGRGDAGAVNAMCARCLNACKQPASARIYKCARYEPVSGADED